MKTPAQLRAWLHQYMVEMDTTQPPPSKCQKVAQVAGKQAARHGLGGSFYDRAQSIDTPAHCLVLLADVLHALGPDGAPETTEARTTQPATTSPYLNSQQAADYLGITRGSLYGLVERRRLTPLRGPRNSYRFTPQMLDRYLHATQL